MNTDQIPNYSVFENFMKTKYQNISFLVLLKITDFMPDIDCGYDFGPKVSVSFNSSLIILFIFENERIPNIE